MATRIVAPVGAPAPAKGITKSAKVNDWQVGHVAREATAISRIVSWVMKANEVLGEIRLRAEIVPGVKEGLTCIPFYSPSEDFSEDVAFLLMRQRDLIGELEAFAEEAGRG